MIYRINTNTSAYKEYNVSYFQDVSIISSCLYISQGLIHFCQDVKCVARSDLIDHFSAYYLSKNSDILKRSGECCHIQSLYRLDIL